MENQMTIKLTFSNLPAGITLPESPTYEDVAEQARLFGLTGKVQASKLFFDALASQDVNSFVFFANAAKVAGADDVFGPMRNYATNYLIGKDNKILPVGVTIGKTRDGLMRLTHQTPSMIEKLAVLDKIGPMLKKVTDESIRAELAAMSESSLKAAQYKLDSVALALADQQELATMQAELAKLKANRTEEQLVHLAKLARIEDQIDCCLEWAEAEAAAKAEAEAEAEAEKEMAPAADKGAITAPREKDSGKVSPAATISPDARKRAKDLLYWLLEQGPSTAELLALETLLHDYVQEHVIAA